MTLQIAYFLKGAPCHGRTPWEKPLGGSESAMIFFAKALVARGHKVFVFTETPQKEVLDGVTYDSYKNFESFALTHDLDILVSIRHFLPLTLRRWAKRQFYHGSDANDQDYLNRPLQISLQLNGKNLSIPLFSLGSVQNHIDAFLYLGTWHQKTYEEHFHLTVKGFQYYNGVELSFFEKYKKNNSRKKQLVYLSTPFRGLEYLLEYFPKIKERVPEATCAVLSGMQTYGFSDEENQNRFGAIYAKANQPGVTLYGPLAKQQMADIIQESSVLAYPNTFNETFCIAAVEAQAGGLPIVTSRQAALCERVENNVNGFLIEGHPSETSYREAFIDKVVSLLKDEITWKRMSEKSRETAERFSYTHLAENFETFCYQELQRPYLPKEPSLLSQNLEITIEGQRVVIPREKLIPSVAKLLSDLGFSQTLPTL